MQTAPLRKFAARLRDDRSGLAAVELALLLPFLLLLLAGLIDYSRLIVAEMQVRSAAQAGADYALRHGWDEAGVAQSVTSATSLPVMADPAPRVMKGCLSGTDVVEASSTLCPSGATPGDYVTAFAMASFRPLMPWPGLSVSTRLSASAMARVQ